MNSRFFGVKEMLEYAYAKVENLHSHHTLF
jgi:hypothetical protein